MLPEEVIIPQKTVTFHFVFAQDECKTHPSPEPIAPTLKRNTKPTSSKWKQSWQQSDSDRHFCAGNQRCGESFQVLALATLHDPLATPHDPIKNEEWLPPLPLTTTTRELRKFEVLGSHQKENLLQ